MRYLKYIRYRWEIVVIISFFLVLVFLSEWLFHRNLFVLDFELFFGYLLLSWSFSLILFFVLDGIYFVSKVFSAVSLRLKELWKYSIPAILAFLLVVFPYFDWVVMEIGFLDLLKSPSSLMVLIFVLIISFVVVLIIPLFYGLNGGFVITASLLSYGLLKSLYLLLSKTFVWWEFYLWFFYLTFLFYLYLQARRRVGLQIYYESYHYPFWFLLILIFNLIFLFSIKVYYQEFFSYLLVLLGLILTTAIIGYVLVINFEFKRAKRIILLPFLIFLFFPLSVWMFTYFYLKNSDFLRMKQKLFYETRDILFIYGLYGLHFLSDEDQDGENTVLGNDLNNFNLFERSEGKYQPNQNETQIIVKNNFHYFIITINLPKKPVPNKNLSISISERIDHTLFGLIYNLSSFEVSLYTKDQLSIKPKSFFTFFTENYYRTICIGFDGKQNYFRPRNIPKLDIGCEVFLRYEEENHQGYDLFKKFINFSYENYQSYKAQKNVVWIHFDFSSLADKNFQIEKEQIINILNEELIQKARVYPNFSRNVFILYFFYQSEIPMYEIEVIPFLTSQLTFLQNDPGLSYYGSLFRYVNFIENFSFFGYGMNVFTTPFFKREFEFKEHQTLNHFVFIEPNDSYWNNITKIFFKPKLPPITITRRDDKLYFYDGRTGYRKTIELQ
ncbi:MAG: hypothetical protein NZ853_01380 [Leptospiraceae bacterium]|nr:hypothetical protein [Leptospiraceae bacterium]